MILLTIYATYIAIISVVCYIKREAIMDELGYG